MSFLSFSWRIALVTSSSTIFNRNGKSRQSFLASDLKGKESFIIKNKISCWLFMDGLSQVNSLPLRVFIMTKWYCYYTKTQLFCFPFSLPFSIFPFLISYQSLVGHQDYESKEETMGCCTSTPWNAMSNICRPSLLSALLTCDALVVWHKLHPSTLICSSGPLSPGSGAPGFLSLSFRVQIPFLSLPRSPRTLWQLLVSGQLKLFSRWQNFLFTHVPVWFHKYFMKHF